MKTIKRVFWLTTVHFTKYNVYGIFIFIFFHLFVRLRFRELLRTLIFKLNFGITREILIMNALIFLDGHYNMFTFYIIYYYYYIIKSRGCNRIIIVQQDLYKRNKNKIYNRNTRVESVFVRTFSILSYFFYAKII